MAVGQGSRRRERCARSDKASGSFLLLARSCGRVWLSSRRARCSSPAFPQRVERGQRRQFVRVGLQYNNNNNNNTYLLLMIISNNDSNINNVVDANIILIIFCIVIITNNK